MRIGYVFLQKRYFFWSGEYIGCLSKYFSDLSHDVYRYEFPAQMRLLTVKQPLGKLLPL